jgi:ABC-2 type transport system permease protein
MNAIATPRRGTASFVMHHARLVGVQLRVAALFSMQYRLDFAINIFLTIAMTAVALAPIAVLFTLRHDVGGWNAAQALLVVGWFTVLKAVLDGAIQPSLNEAVERIRFGTLDFVLLKPVDSQFLLSISRFNTWKAADVLTGLVLVAYSLRRLGHVPSLGAVAITIALLAGASVILYSIWMLFVTLSFSFVGLERAAYVLTAVYDAARWPSSVFRGVLGVIFTFVIPITVMTTFPALAIQDQLALRPALGAIAAAVVLAVLARIAWTRSVRRYTSIGG